MNFKTSLKRRRGARMNFKTSLKEHRPLLVQIGLLGFLFITYSAVLRFVYPYGDDFFYGMFVRGDWSYFVERHVEHYFRANGRVMVHLLDTCFMQFQPGAWRMLNALLVVLIVFLSARLAVRDRSNRSWAILFLASGFLIFHIALTRQTIFWQTGSFNYVLPMAIFLLYWVCLEHMISRSVQAWWMPIIGFLAGATVEQVGMMALGVTVLMTLHQWMTGHRKPDRYLVMTLLAVFLGLATVVLSPAVAYRASLEKAPAEGILNLLRYNAVKQGYQFIYSDITFPSLLMMCFAGILQIAKTAAGFRNKACRLLLPGLAFMVEAVWLFRKIAVFKWNAYPALPQDLEKLLDVAVAMGLVVIFLASSWFWYRKNEVPFPLICVILAFGAQFMMLVSPVFGPRNLLCSLILLNAAAGCMMVGVFAPAHGRRGGDIVGVPPERVFMEAGAHLIYQSSLHSAITKIALCVFFVVSLISFRGTYKGYTRNAEVYRENNARILLYLHDMNKDFLVLKRLPDDTYAWVMPYHNAYYTPYFKRTNYIPAATRIAWVAP